jgi:hypothetical protein
LASNRWPDQAEVPQFALAVNRPAVALSTTTVSACAIRIGITIAAPSVMIAAMPKRIALVRLTVVLR